MGYEIILQQTAIPSTPLHTTRPTSFLGLSQKKISLLTGTAAYFYYNRHFFFSFFFFAVLLLRMKTMEAVAEGRVLRFVGIPFRLPSNRDLILLPNIKRHLNLVCPPLASLPACPRRWLLPLSVATYATYAWRHDQCRAQGRRRRRGRTLH